MNPEYTIVTPQSEEDLKRYYDFRYQLLRKPFDMPVGSEKDSMEDQSSHRMILDKNNNIVAIGRVHLNTDKEAQCRYIATDENFRGKGLGRMMVQELERTAKEQGAEEMLIDSRDYAVEFYSKVGYTVIGDSKKVAGHAKYKEMRKKL